MTHSSTSLIGICENIDFSLVKTPRAGCLPNSTSAFLMTTASSAVAWTSFVPGLSPSLFLTSGGSWTAPLGRTFVIAMIGSSGNLLSPAASRP
jgi:hypothetical protein